MSWWPVASCPSTIATKWKLSIGSSMLVSLSLNGCPFPRKTSSKSAWRRTPSRGRLLRNYYSTPWYQDCLLRLKKIWVRRILRVNHVVEKRGATQMQLKVSPFMCSQLWRKRYPWSLTVLKAVRQNPVATRLVVTLKQLRDSRCPCFL